MGFRKWLEKDRSRSTALLLLGYVVAVPIELLIGALVGFIPAFAIKIAFSAVGLPVSIWHVIVFPVWIISGVAVLLLLVGGDADGIAVFRLIRGRFRPG